MIFTTLLMALISVTAMQQEQCAIATKHTVSLGTTGSVEFGEIAGGGFLNDSTLAVADRIGHVVHLFSTSGKLLRSVGKTGSGPGEFRGIHRVWVVGDTAVILDQNLGRITLITEKGVVGSFLAGTIKGPAIRALLPGGAFVTTSPINVQRRGLNGPELWYDSVELAVERGERSMILGTFLSAVRLIDVSKQFSVISAPYSPTLSVATVGNYVFVSDGSQTIRRYTSQGEQRGTIKITWQPEVLSRASYASWIDYYAENSRGQDKSVVRRLFDPVKSVRLAPVVARVMESRPGWLWLEQYRAPHDGRSVGVMAVSAEGEPIVQGALPARSAVLAATRGMLAAIQRDDDGVETVRLYAIRCSR